MREWTENGRLRVCLESWIGGGRRRVYSDVNQWRDRKDLTRELAQELFDDIRAEIRTRRSIEEALAPFLGASAPENLIGARWKRFLELEEREAKVGRITVRHLRELRAVERRRYLDFLLDRSIYEIDFGLLEEWLSRLAETKPELSPKTRKNAHSTVVAFSRWLQRRREIRRVPEVPELRVPQHSPVLLSESTHYLSPEAIPENARCVFLAMALIGLGLGEARGMDARARRDRMITVDTAAKHQETDGEIGSTKTESVRVLPVARKAAECIEKYTSKRARLEGGAMLTDPRGHTKSKRWSPGAMDRTCARACIAVLGRVTPRHEGTRHSYATQALARGEEMYKVQRNLGHSDPKTAEIYAKLAEGATISVLRPKSRSQSKEVR